VGARNLKNLKNKLPDFPRTPHLPHKPNTVTGDFVSSEAEVAVLFSPGSAHVSVQEKIDGANCGIAYIDDHPVIRNRTKILTKGFYKDTQAKKQFLPTWNWAHENKKKFQELEACYPDLTVYGEWMQMAHGLRYDQLPDWFIAYDLYDQVAGKFLSPHVGIPMLQFCGFAIAPEILTGAVLSWEQLEEACNQRTLFSSTEIREGIYVKVADDHFVTARHKMVREGFKQGGLWEQGLKNALK